MSKDTLSMMLAAQAILDAKPIQQHGRMAWDGLMMHIGTMTSRTGPEEKPHADSGYGDIPTDRVLYAPPWWPTEWIEQTGAQVVHELPRTEIVAEIEKTMLACFTEGTGAMAQSLDGVFMHLPNTDLFAWPAPVQVEIPPLVPVRARAPGRANCLTMALRAAYP